MIYIRCDLPLEETEDNSSVATDYISVQNMVISENVRIIVTKKEAADDYEFVVNGPRLIEAIKRCIG